MQLTALEAYNATGLPWAAQPDVDNAIQHMERNGIGIDVPFFHEAANRAADDEYKKLAELRKDLYDCGYVPVFKDKKKGVDDVWRSVDQLRKLVHGHLHLPKSPIWKLGGVKREEIKLDEVALAWIGKQPESAGSKSMLTRMIDLRRIRSSLKYLRKMPGYLASDGLVHPICGPAGDLDDRVGAVTGRLGMKKPEGQQLPRNKKKDTYRVRRGFVCGPTPWGSGFRLALQVHDELIIRGHGKLIVADYSTLEIRILAHIIKVLFGDNQMAEACDPAAPDLHSWNAREIFGRLLKWKVDNGPNKGKDVSGMPLSTFKCTHNPECKGDCGDIDPFCAWLRDIVKNVWYGLQYGKGSYGFGNTLLGPDGRPIGEERAGEIVEGLLTARPGIRRYQNWVREFIFKYGGISGLDGRWCDLSGLVESDNKWDHERAWRRALNFPMQNGGACIISSAMVQVVKDDVLRRTTDFDMASQRLVHLMVKAFPLDVPLAAVAHIGDNYDACK